MSEEWNLSIWEDDEYVITYEGKPIGETLTKSRAKSILLWLKTTKLPEELKNEN